MPAALRDHSGKISSMRLGFATCLGAGALLVAAGIIAMFAGLDGAEVAMSTGAGMMTGSGFAKAIQSQAERRGVPNERTDSG
jgi:hypothetical protein